MADPSPWAFGWTQLFTIGGLGIGLYGLRTFDRWRREKVEEKRIEVAVDALAAAYKSKYVFEYIRGRLLRPHEYEDMPDEAGEYDKERARRGSIWAVLRRIERNKEFFDHTWELQPKFMAIFGRETEEIFLLLHTARRDIETACEMILWMKDEVDEEQKLLLRLRRDVWSSPGPPEEDDEVGKKLMSFRTRIETLCRPVVDHELKGLPPEFFRTIKKTLRSALCWHRLKQ